MAKGPKYDLEEVKRIVREYLAGDDTLVNFTAPRRSIDVVVTVLKCTPHQATQKIASGLMTLTEDDFSERVWQWNDVYDSYGLESYEGHNWYVKYCLVTGNGDYIEEVSFHPVERELRLSDGRVLEVTDSGTQVKDTK